MNAKNFSFFIIFLAGFFVFAVVSLKPDTILAQEEIIQEETVSVKIKSAEIKDVKIMAKDDKLEISAILFNPSQNVGTAPFTHLLTLSSINQLFKFGKSTITPPPIIVSALEGSDYVSLKPQEQKMVSFSLPVSRYLPKNNYTLNIAMILSGGEALDSYHKVIYDLGSNQKTGDFYKDGFLAFDQGSCVIITPDGRKFGNNDGPIIKPSETPKISCAVKNVGQEEITVFPNIEWKEFFVYGRPASGKKAVEKSDKAIIFKSGEVKTIELSLPEAERPQVYQALLSFIDKNNIIRSYNMPFRWTIGGHSARVEKVALTSPLKAIYEAGETVSLSIDYYGSMDLFWGGISEDKVSALSEVKILAVIKDKKGAVCGQTEAMLPDVNDAGIQNKIIDIKLDKKCASISYDTSLFSRGENLADASDVFPAVIEKAVQEKTQEKSGVPFIYYIIGAFILVAAYKIVVVINRRKHKDDWQKTLMLFLLIAGATGFFLGGFNTAEAAVRNLTVDNGSGDGIGGGTVKEPSPGATNINCSTGNTGVCLHSYTLDTVIYLEAFPNPGSAISEWSANCTVTGNVCKTRMGASKTVKVKFKRTYTVTIGGADSSKANLLPPNVYADGSGTITGSGINCIISNGTTISGDCSESYPSGIVVSMSYNPLSQDEIFAGWTGDCPGVGSCNLLMDGDKTANAVFYKIETLKRNSEPKTRGFDNQGGAKNIFASTGKALSSPVFRDSLITSAYFYIGGNYDGVMVNPSDGTVDINFSYSNICGNTTPGFYFYTRVKMAVVAQGLPETEVHFREKGTVGDYEFSNIFDIASDIINSDRTKSYEIKPDDFNLLAGEEHPRLILYFMGATIPSGVSPIYYRKGIINFTYTDPYNFNIDVDKFDIGLTPPPPPAAAVFAASDVIRIRINLDDIPPSNQPPVLTLNPVGNQTVNENQPLTINVSAADPDAGDTLTYSASSLPIVPSPLPSGASFAGQTFSWTPTYSQAGTYNVRFTVNDGNGGTDSEDITITVNNVNQLPTATINPPTSIEKYDNDDTGEESVTLNGSSSSDLDGIITSYQWTEGATPLGSGVNITPSFSVGSHTVTLTVTDNDGGVSTVSSPPATIIVYANALPTANAGDDQTVTDTDGNNSESVTLNGSGSSDLNGGIITSYQWTEGATPLGSGVNITPSFSVGSHTVTLTVTDNGGLTDTDDVSITVNSSAPLTPSNWWDLFRTLWKEKK